MLEINPVQVQQQPRYQLPSLSHMPSASLVPLSKHSHPDSSSWNTSECNPGFNFQGCCTFSGCQLQCTASKEGTEVSMQPHQNECALIVSGNYFTRGWIREVMTYQITEWAPACVNMAPKSLVSVFLHPLYEFGIFFFSAAPKMIAVDKLDKVLPKHLSWADCVHLNRHIAH